MTYKLSSRRSSLGFVSIAMRTYATSVCRNITEGGLLKACPIFRDSLVEDDLKVIKKHWGFTEMTDHVIEVLEGLEPETMKQIAKDAKEKMLKDAGKVTYFQGQPTEYPEPLCGYEKHGDPRYCFGCPVGRIMVNSMEMNFQIIQNVNDHPIPE